MRSIELEPDLKVRFSGRNGDFDEGVEVGMVAAMMALGRHPFERRVSPLAIEQLRPLAERLGYTIIAGEAEQGLVPIRVTPRGAVRQFRVVR